MEPTLDVGQRVLVNRFIYHFNDPEDRRHRRLPPARRRRQRRPNAASSRDHGEAVPASRPKASRARTSSSGSSPGRATRSRSRKATRSSTGREDRRALHQPLRRRRRLQFAEDDHDPARPLLHDGRQPWGKRRQPLLGTRPPRLDHRRGLCHLLAPRPHRHPLRSQGSRTAAGWRAAAACSPSTAACRAATSPAPTRPGAVAWPGRWSPPRC